MSLSQTMYPSESVIKCGLILIELIEYFAACFASESTISFVISLECAFTLTKCTFKLSCFTTLAIDFQIMYAFCFVARLGEIEGYVMKFLNVEMTDAESM